MFGGLRITPTVKILLIINVAVFGAQALLNLPVREFMSLYYFQSPYFLPFQAITHIFVHADFSHLLHNMLPLLFLAPLIEQYISPKRFLQLYLFCGLGASAMYAGVQHIEMQNMQMEAVEVIQNPSPEGADNFIIKHASYLYQSTEIDRFMHQQYPANPQNKSYQDEVKTLVKDRAQFITNKSTLMGASGAVFGILMAFVLLFPNMELMLLFIPFPIKSKYLIGAYGLYEVYSLVQNRADDNVAHLAHLGGMLFAFILIKLVWKMKRIH